MIEKRTIVDQVEVAKSGHLHIRFAVQLVEDGKVIEEKWHRTSVEPGGDVDAQIAAVNANLEMMGKARVVDLPGLARARAVALAAHTPEVVAAFRNGHKP